MKVEFAKQEELNVKTNDERTWDFTNPAPGQANRQHSIMFAFFIINTYLFLVSSGLHILMEGPLGKVEKFLSLIFLAPQ